jgi:starch synthase
VELLFVAPEITPYSRTGEIGDVCAALPKALRGGGHKVTLLSPLWPGIDPRARGFARRLSGVEVSLLGQRFACTLYDGRTTAGVELVFVAQPELFAHGPGSGDERAACLAALGFSQAAAQVIAARDSAPDAVHAHGWFAAASLPLLAKLSPQVTRVLSVHDPRQLGGLPAGVDRDALPQEVAEAAGAPGSLLRAGIVAAQHVIASSDADARAIEHEALGLADAAQGKLAAIQNGLDASRWNPLTDAMIASRFDPIDLRGKARCKDALQFELGLKVAADVPLVACVGALGRDSGGGLLERALSSLLQNELQVVVAGGDAQLATTIEGLSARYEERLRPPATLDDRAAHRAVAAADFVLVPALDPTYPDLHLCAQRYGALPIARSAGAIADTIVDCDAQLTTGTGFVFDGDDPAELTATVQRALAAFAQRAAFDALRRRVMKLDVSWERAAGRYEHAYKTPAARPAG